LLFKNKLINTIREKKVLLSNFFSLSIFQLVNYLIPLLLMPFLIKTIGMEKFGLIMFAQAFMQYFVILTDFGFNYIATKEISKNRNNPKLISEIVSAVYSIKIILLLISFLILSLLILWVEKLYINYDLIYISFGIVVGQVLFPIWLFQGFEKMKIMVIINALSKILILSLVFLLIHSESDFMIFPLLWSLSFITAGIFSIFYIKKYFKIEYKIQKISVLIKYYNLSKDIFISNVVSSLYLTSNPVILGLVSTEIAVAYYTIAEKSVRVIRYVLSPITQAIFPHYSAKFSKQSFDTSLKQIKSLLLKLSPIIFIIILGVIFFARHIVFFLSGEIVQEVIIDMYILSAIILIGTFNNIIGVLGFINLDMNKEFKLNVIYTGYFSVIVTTALSFYYADLGASIALVLSETILLFLLVHDLYVRRKLK